MPSLTLIADILRYGVFVEAGVGVGFMITTNFIAFHVLRPAGFLGFLWWHVTSISLSFMLIGSVALDNILYRIGDGFTWRAPVMFLGTTLFATAQLIIFKVERSRLITKQAVEIARGKM